MRLPVEFAAVITVRIGFFFFFFPRNDEARGVLIHSPHLSFTSPAPSDCDSDGLPFSTSNDDIIIF